MVVVVADDDVAGDSSLRLTLTSDGGVTIAVVVDPGTLVASVTVDAGPLLQLFLVTIGGATTSDKDDLVILLKFPIEWLVGVGSQCIRLAR